MTRSDREHENTGGAELLAAIAAGEPAAWAGLVERYGGLLRHICRQYRLSDERADDVVQNTWVTLIRHVDGIHNPEGLGAWLATTARRECLAQHRRSAREIPAEEYEFEVSGPDPMPEADERLDAHRHRPRLRRAIAALPPRDRAVIGELLAADQPSYAEISRRLNIPIGAIGPVRKRALGRLREQLESGTPVAGVRVPA